MERTDGIDSRRSDADSRRHQGRRALLIGGLLTGIASVLHVAIIWGGPAWYRFFGAGEAMARLAARGSPYPTVITAGIAGSLALWTIYALSGAGTIRRLPFLRPVLRLISAIYLARGLLGLPAVLLAEDPYMQELRRRPIFMVVSSAICVGLGLCYAVGAASVGKQGAQHSRTDGEDDDTSSADALSS